MNRYCLLFAIAIVALMPVVAKGQASTAMARVSGVAVDSINGGYLKGASIFVSGTSRTATTDSAGRFTIDSIPAGSRILEIQHPLLDTLGVSVVTANLEFAPGSDLVAILSTPSPDKLIAAKCRAEEINRGRSALLGSLTDPDLLQPVSGAVVTLDWVDIDIEGKNFTRKPRHASAQTATDGTFRICGLPGDFTANLQASAGADSTAILGVTFQRPLVIVGLTLGRSVRRTAADSASGRAVLRGRVVNTKGEGVSGARVSVDDRDAIAISGDSGQFVLSSLPSGTRLLTARRIGFEPTEQVVRLSSARETNATVMLGAPVQTLETVRVTALSSIGLSARGFFERQQSAKGNFFDPEYLAKRRPFHLNEVLVPLAYVKEVPNPRIHGTTTITPRNKWECVEYVVDGHPWLQHLSGNKYFYKDDSTLAGGNDRGSPNEWINGNELAAVEAYAPMHAPPEIQRMTTQGGACTTVVVWTKWKMGAK
jgi:hypothetical protein